jgi:hypothetical protein
VEVISQRPVLLEDEVLDGCDESKPLSVALVLDALKLGIHNNCVHKWQHTNSFQDQKAFSIELTSVPILVESMLSHHEFVTLGDNSNQEIKQDNENNKLV